MAAPLLPSLRIRVRLFAMQRETAGMRELRLEVPVGATVDDAWDAVVGTVPALAPGRASLRFAVNGTYADPDTT
ncbi:MAG TPA: MoaD/ThiS family protein, partial [Candidatus Limnocylindrales bacterium]